MAIHAPSLLHQTHTSARELLTTYFAIDKLSLSTFQARLVPTLRARWPNAQSRAMGPNRWRSWPTWPLAQFPRLHEARSLGTSFTKPLPRLYLDRDSIPSIQFPLTIYVTTLYYQIRTPRIYIPVLYSFFGCDPRQACYLERNGD